MTNLWMSNPGAHPPASAAIPASSSTISTLFTKSTTLRLWLLASLLGGALASWVVLTFDDRSFGLRPGRASTTVPTLRVERLTDLSELLTQRVEVADAVVTRLDGWTGGV